MHDRPPSHPKRIERRVLAGHTPTRLPALCCLCRCPWSIVALFGTMGPENKNERSRGSTALYAAITSEPLPRKKHPSNTRDRHVPATLFPFSLRSCVCRDFPKPAPTRPIISTRLPPCQEQMAPNKPPPLEQYKRGPRRSGAGPEIIRNHSPLAQGYVAAQPPRATGRSDCSPSLILLAGLTQPQRSRLRRI